MRNKLEHILLSVLLGISILLGLSFWLNTIFSFNLFCASHWDDLAKLQASHTPITNGFYISFGVATFLFIAGVFLIYRPAIHRIKTTANKETVVAAPVERITEEKIENTYTVTPTIPVSRPPRLNLPKNMAQIVVQNNSINQTKQKNEKEENPYTPMLAEIFSNAGYVVKPNPMITGFTPNLFAIGNNEMVWIGGIDCDLDKMMTAIEKLQSVFQETLEDIPISVNAFILDTLKKYNSQNTSIMIFQSIDEIKAFIDEHPADAINEDDKDSFDSYSEYIDTIIQYIKNI